MKGLFRTLMRLHIYVVLDIWLNWFINWYLVHNWQQFSCLSANLGCQVGSVCLCEYSEIYPVSVDSQCGCSCYKCCCCNFLWWCSTERSAGLLSLPLSGLCLPTNMGHSISRFLITVAFFTASLGESYHGYSRSTSFGNWTANWPPDGPDSRGSKVRILFFVLLLSSLDRCYSWVTLCFGNSEKWFNMIGGNPILVLFQTFGSF